MQPLSYLGTRRDPCQAHSFHCTRTRGRREAQGPSGGRFAGNEPRNHQGGEEDVAGAGRVHGMVGRDSRVPEMTSAAQGHPSPVPCREDD